MAVRFEHTPEYLGTKLSVDALNYRIFLMKLDEIEREHKREDRKKASQRRYRKYK